MRLIDAENFHIPKGFFNNGINVPKMYELLGLQPTIAPSPKWIPVTERLPDLIPCNAGTAYSEAVIIWTDGRKAMIAVWDGIDFLCAADYWEAWGENITHWMPLPKPLEMDGGADHAVT